MQVAPDIAVTHVSSREETGYVCTTLKVVCGKLSRQVQHWWFTAWPDHGTPKKDGKNYPVRCAFSNRINSLEDAIGSHACSLEANMRATNVIPLGIPLLLLLS
jgi:hypothetical protein